MPIEPLYRVGQQVVITSRTCQEQNGQVQTVIDVCWRSEHICHITKKALPPGWVYSLSDGCGVPWDESALRPYDPPASQSFDEMMSEWTKTKEKV